MSNRTEPATTLDEPHVDTRETEANRSAVPRSARSTPASVAGQAPRVALDRYSGVIVLIVLIVVFCILRPDTFMTVRTLRSVVSDQAVTAIASIGLLIAFACGAFDLSVGGVLGLGIVMVVWLQSQQGFPAWLAVIITLLVGMLVGVVNGLLVTVLKVNSFIATLAMASILDAVIYGVSGGRQIIGKMSPTFLRLGQSQHAGIPVTIFYMAAIALVVWVMLEHSPVGRYIYAVGSNSEAARLSGVRTSWYLFGSLVASALLATLAGIVFAAKIGSASLTAGPPYLLPAFAAVLLGTTQVRPGRANVAGTIVAIFLVATGSKGLQLMGVPIWVSSLFNGTVLIVAVALSQLRKRAKAT
jgi:ribose transport system permease protein